MYVQIVTCAAACASRCHGNAYFVVCAHAKKPWTLQRSHSLFVCVRESVCVCERERVCVCTCVCERERESVCVCTCECEFSSRKLCFCFPTTCKKNKAMHASIKKEIWLAREPAVLKL